MHETINSICIGLLALIVLWLHQKRFYIEINGWQIQIYKRISYGHSKGWFKIGWGDWI